MTVGQTELSALVRQQLEQILADPAEKARFGLTGLGVQDRDRLDTVEHQISGILNDRSIGNAAHHALWLNGASVINGTITADKLVVATLSAISADVGTLNAGTINAAAMTITNLTASSITTGTLVADRISGGSLGGGFNLGTADVTINSTGKLKFGASSADYLSDDILHFEVAEGAAPVLELKNASMAASADIYGGVTESPDVGIIAIRALGTSDRLAFTSYYGTGVDSTTKILTRVFDTSSALAAEHSLYGNGVQNWYTSTALGMRLGNGGGIELELFGPVALVPGSADTIASGVATVTESHVILVSQAGPNDNLDTLTLTGAVAGTRCVLRAASGDTITVKDGTGNILNGGDFAMVGSNGDTCELIYDGSNWLEMTRANN